MVFQNGGVLQCELEKQPWQRQVNLRLLVHAGWRTLSFKTALQNATAQSTLEAKLISVAHAIKEATYVSNIMAELTFEKLI